jgi:tape measure domain-containing protein
MSKIGELYVAITGDNSDLKKALGDSSKDVAGFGTTVTKQLAGIVSATAVLGAAVRGIEFNKAAEQAEVAFTVMTGSATKAKQVLSDLKTFANTTPLEFKDLRDGTQTLVQFGIKADDAVAIIKRLGDVSGGNAQRMQSLSIAFGQMSAAGKLSGQDLLQFINAGFNPLLEISEATGESMESLKKRMEKGAISSDMVAQSFKRATSEGGQFYQMLQKQGQTLAGAQSTLNDAIDTSLGKLMESFSGPIKASMQIATNILNMISDLPGPVRAATATFIGLATAIGAVTTAASLMGKAIPAAMGPVGIALAAVTAGVMAIGAAINSEQDRLKAMRDEIELTRKVASGFHEENLDAQRDALELQKMKASADLAAAQAEIKKYETTTELKAADTYWAVQDAKAARERIALINEAIAATNREQKARESVVEVAKYTVQTEKELEEQAKKAKEAKEEQLRVAMEVETAIGEASRERYRQIEDRSVFETAMAQQTADAITEAIKESDAEQRRIIEDRSTFEQQDANRSVDIHKKKEAEITNIKKGSVKQQVSETQEMVQKETAAAIGVFDKIASGIVSIGVNLADTNQELASTIGTLGALASDVFKGISGDVTGWIGAAVTGINAVIDIFQSEEKKQKEASERRKKDLEEEKKYYIQLRDERKKAYDEERELERKAEVDKRKIEMDAGKSEQERARAEAQELKRQEMERKNTIQETRKETNDIMARYDKSYVKTREQLMNEQYNKDRDRINRGSFDDKDKIERLKKLEEAYTKFRLEQNDMVFLSLEKINQRQESFLSSFTSFGASISESLTSALTQGLDEGGFMESMKKWLTGVVVQAAVYTDELKTQMAQIGQAIADAISGGLTGDALAGIKSQLSSLYQTASARASAATSIVSSAFGSTPSYASGTNYHPGGAAIVGEQGRELVMLPRGAQVVPNNKTEQMIGGATNTFVFNSPVELNPAEMKKQFTLAQRRAAFEGAYA